MATSAKRSPPKFKDDLPYSAWKNKVQMWQLVTGVVKKEQAIIVLLEGLEGNSKAEKAVSQLTREELHAESGMSTLIGKLDAAFKTESVDDAYSTYTKFTRFDKSTDMTMIDYILEFEHLSHKMTFHEMELPDTILSFKLLDGANLTSKERQLALTFASDLRFESMKSALKRIFTESPISDKLSQYIDVKEESYVASNPRHRKGFDKRKFNPIDKFGKISRCVICDSKMHWAAKCPHKSCNTSTNDVSDDEVNIVLFSSVTNSCAAETYKSAVIDTACSKTVCGKRWLRNYLRNLHFKFKRDVKITPSRTVFKFGDGKKVISKSQALIPACVGGKLCSIDVCVVKNDLPLLLSRSSLQKAGAVLDLARGRATMFNKDVELFLSSSGHYCVGVIPRRHNPGDNHFHDRKTWRSPGNLARSSCPVRAAPKVSEPSKAHTKRVARVISKITDAAQYEDCGECPHLANDERNRYYFNACKECKKVKGNISNGWMLRPDDKYGGRRATDEFVNISSGSYFSSCQLEVDWLL